MRVWRVVAVDEASMMFERLADCSWSSDPKGASSQGVQDHPVEGVSDSRMAKMGLWGF